MQPPKLFTTALVVVVFTLLAGRAAAQSPSETFATRFTAANTYAAEHRWAEAIAAYQQALRFNPVHAEAFYRLGEAQAALDQYKDASKSFKRAAKINPYYMEAHYHRGQMLMKLRRYEEAVDAYWAAVGAKPDDAAAHFALAEAYLKLGKTDKALMQHERLKELDEKLAAQLFDEMFFRKATAAIVDDGGAHQR